MYKKAQVIENLAVDLNSRFNLDYISGVYKIVSGPALKIPVAWITITDL